MFKKSLFCGSLAASLLLVGCSSSNDSLSYASMSKIGTYSVAALNKDAGAEIVAYDKNSQQLYVTNLSDDGSKIDIIAIKDAKNPSLVKSIDMSPYGGVNSVAVGNKFVAVAVQGKNSKQDKGSVVFFDTKGKHLKTVEAGFLPDMVTFNEDSTKVVVANEGEPDKTYTNDPVGTIGIIDVSTFSYTSISLANVKLLDAQDGTKVRLGATPSSNQAKDLEPEYITVINNYAYVTLQENNAMAKVNLNNNTLEYVKSYGTKSFEKGNSTIDIEEEGKILMKNYKGLFALYQPDSIASYTVNGEVYIVTANEGDGREYGDFNDEKKIKKLELASSIKSEYKDENDLKVMLDLGKNEAGEYEKLYTYGARSFSIWDKDANLVWDSGDDIAKRVAYFQSDLFNKDDGEKDGRSGNKGAEPEALTVGKIGNKVYAFVGLERQDAIVVYDITNPKKSFFKEYIITSIDGKSGDMAPEGMKFIEAKNSPTNKNLLIVASEGSGTTAIYEINTISK